MKRLFLISILCMALIVPSLPAAAYPPDSEYNVSDMASANITAETPMGGFTIIPATDGGEAVMIDGSNKTGSVTKIKYTKRLKTGATGSYTNRAVRFSTEGPAVLYLDCGSANSKNSRTGKIIDSNNNVIESQEVKPGLAYYKFFVQDAGDYAFVSEGGGINIYYLKLSYDLPEPEPDFEDLKPVVGDQLSEIYTAPLAPANGKGTKDEPMSVASAIANIAPGGVIYCEGKYMFNDCLYIPFGNNGAEGAEKRIECPDGTVFDFSYEPYGGNGSARGLQMDGDYWHIKGLEVYMAADNGFYVTGKHNTLELCRANANRDTGIQISRRSSDQSNFDDWPSDNLILNCTSYNSFDPDTGENADGFAAKLTCGNGNVFDGCIAYNNCDDGWDCFTKSDTGPIGTLVFRNCVSFRNGQTTDGAFTDNSDGNGFKMGGEKIAVTHYMYNCVSFENANHGFTDNSNPGPIYLYNCTSFNNSLKGGTNKSNFDFARDKENSNNTIENCLSYTSQKIAADKFLGTIKNSVVYNNSKGLYYYYEDFPPITNWNDKLGEVLPSDTMDTVSESTFVSVETPLLGADVHKYWRNEDGSINLGDFLKTAEGTAFREKNIGADLSGAPIEYPSASPEPSAVPTAEPKPSDTPEPSAASTAEPQPSDTPEPSAASTAEPRPSDTPEPSAVSTAEPQPSDTPKPSEAPSDKPDYVLKAAPDDEVNGMFNVHFENNTNTQVEPYIIAAAYKIIDGIEFLVDFDDEMITADGGAEDFNISLSGAAKNGDCDLIRIFALKDYEDLIPLAGCVEIKR